jgi:hypothetical protein
MRPLGLVEVSRTGVLSIERGAGYFPAWTMEINARVISGLDPGAIPGGSTNWTPIPRLHHSFFPRYRRGCMGPISIDRRLKALLSPGVAHRFGPFLTANDNFAQEYALAA